MDWKTLIDTCAQGNEAAFREFVNTYYGFLSYLVARRVKPPDDRQDILQEIFFKCHRLNLFAKFKGHSVGEWRAYLAQICFNTVTLYHKRRKIDYQRLFFMETTDLERLAAADAGGDPLPGLLEREALFELEAAIDALPLAYRDAVNLRLLGHTNKEIADILKRPKGTIDSHLAAALGILREKLKKFTSSGQNRWTH